MNREILFKAKRIDNEEWVEGYYYKTYGCRNGKKHDVHFIHTYEEDEHYEIDPSTICQYTGLNDKNGNKIWENDFLHDRHTFYKVRWDDKFARFIVDEYTKYNGKYVVIDRRGFNYFKEAPEIVWNKFDNPELLEGGVEEC